MKREDQLLEDLVKLGTENLRLQDEVALLKEQVRALAQDLKPGEVTVKAIVGEPLKDQVSYGEMLVPVETLKMPEGGVLVVATIGNENWEPSVEDIDSVVQTLMQALDASTKVPYAVLGFANGVKVDAFLVKSADA